MCTWWISVIMWWSSWRWMSGRRRTVSPNVWPSRLRWWLRKELGERQEARIKGSMKVENFLIMMYFPFLSFLPICTPPSRPINLMSLLCCDCLEGMRLEGHQGWLCVTLARGCWKSWCCWFFFLVFLFFVLLHIFCNGQSLLLLLVPLLLLTLHVP